MHRVPTAVGNVLLPVWDLPCHKYCALFALCTLEQWCRLDKREEKINNTRGIFTANSVRWTRKKHMSQQNSSVLYKRQILRVCHHSVQNLLPSSLLLKNVKIKIHKTIILPILYGCETWSLRLREESRLGGFSRIGC
jgi:hypothetical protein